MEQQPHRALFVSKKQFCAVVLYQNWLFVQSEAEWDFLGGCLRLCIGLSTGMFEPSPKADNLPSSPFSRK